MAEKKLTQPAMPRQRGPNCGLYALTAAARALDGQRFADLYATKGDPHNPGTRNSVRSTAKVNNRTLIGEIFSAAAMVALAQDIGLQARIRTNNGAWTPPIKEAIDAGRYLLAPFGVADNGQPQSDGHSSHWCVIYGYKETWIGQNVAYVVHWGWSYSFGTSSLRKSSLALTRFNETWHKYDRALKFKKVGTGAAPVQAGGGVQGGNAPVNPSVHFAFDADLPKNLAGKLVEVWI